jgi:DNA-directed RNA polymerase specialized sigma24 family protein
MTVILHGHLGYLGHPKVGSFRAWLKTVVRHALNDFLRGQQRLSKTGYALLETCLTMVTSVISARRLLEDKVAGHTPSAPYSSSSSPCPCLIT